MAWTIPDKGEGDNDLQSILFQEYLDVLIAGLAGVDCVLSGCAITGGADMTPAVAKGAVLSNGVLFAVTAGDVTIPAADATNPRIDLIVVTSAGAKAVRQGTAAAAPKPPARTANDVVLGAVYVPANDTSIETTKIVDMRVMRGGGSLASRGAPVIVKKQTTPVVFNNTAAIQTYFTLTLPSGLFLSGAQLRLRMGGTMLLNSGTPTVRLVIAFGGSTLFSDISGASTGDADRVSWDLDITLTAQANNDQNLNGLVCMGIIAAKTAPTTGIGDVWSTAYNIGSINGASAVDADAADRTFTVQMTMSVANAADEIACEYAVAELI